MAFSRIVQLLRVLSTQQPTVGFWIHNRLVWLALVHHTCITQIIIVSFCIGDAKIMRGQSGNTLSLYLATRALLNVFVILFGMMSKV